MGSGGFLVMELQGLLPRLPRVLDLLAFHVRRPVLDLLRLEVHDIRDEVLRFRRREGSWSGGTAA